jgi:hypothetical protein
MADTLTLIAAGPEESPSEDARERELANLIEERLRVGIPDACFEFVDPNELQIQTGGKSNTID